jgi:hypothetical protein
MNLAIEPDLFDRINPKVRLRWMIKRVLTLAKKKAIAEATKKALELPTL